MDCQCDVYGCTLPGPPTWLCWYLNCTRDTLFCFGDPGVAAFCQLWNYQPTGGECGCSGFSCFFG